MVKSKKHSKIVNKNKTKSIKHKRNSSKKVKNIKNKNKERGYKIKTKKGGVLLNDDFPNRAQALLYFIRNSKFKILTNSSLTCITLVASLNPGFETPFYSARSNNFKVPVKKILLKLSITNKAGEAPAMLPIPGREYNGIRLMTVNEIIEEVNLQKRIYRKSFVEPYFNSPFDAICPAIIETAMHIDKLGGLRLANFFINNLEARNGKTLENDKAELVSILNYMDNRFPNNNISMIAMEFMDGFSTFYEAFQNGQIIPSHFHMVNYVFKQLHDLGYMHNDAHINNMMINPNIPYFTSTGRLDVMGRVIIIDFGRTTLVTNEQRALSEHQRLELETFYIQPFWNIYKYDERINNVLTLGRKRVVDNVFTPIIAQYMAANGLPLPHDPYTLLNSIIIPRNLYDRYFLVGGLKTIMPNIMQTTPSLKMLTKKLKTPTATESLMTENYDEDRKLDTKYYNTLKEQLQNMPIDVLKDNLVKILDLSDNVTTPILGVDFEKML